MQPPDGPSQLVSLGGRVCKELYATVPQMELCGVLEGQRQMMMLRQGKENEEYLREHLVQDSVRRFLLAGREIG